MGVPRLLVRSSRVPYSVSCGSIGVPRAIVDPTGERRTANSKISWSIVRSAGLSTNIRSEIDEKPGLSVGTRPRIDGLLMVPSTSARMERISRPLSAARAATMEITHEPSAASSISTGVAALFCPPRAPGSSISTAGLSRDCAADFKPPCHITVERLVASFGAASTRAAVSRSAATSIPFTRGGIAPIIRALSTLQGELTLHRYPATQGVEDHAVAFGVLQQPLGPVLILLPLQSHARAAGDALEADRNVAREAHRAAQVQLANRLHLQGFQLDAHRRRHHAHRDLLTGRQRAEQDVTRARHVAQPAHARMGARAPHHAGYGLGRDGAVQRIGQVAGAARDAQPDGGRFAPPDNAP